MAKEYKLISAFNGGEVSPLLDGRADLEKYSTFLKICRNFLVTPQGPLISRPGFKYINEVKNSSDQVRLIPFRFSDQDAYVLEFGDQYVRFHKFNGTLQAIDTDQVVLFHFNDGNGSVTMQDDSSNSYDVDNVTHFARGTAQVLTDNKKFGSGSLYPDGDSDYLEFDNSTAFGTSVNFGPVAGGGTDEDWAFDCWIYPEAGNADPYTLFSQRTGANDFYRLHLNSNISLLLRTDEVNGNQNFYDKSPVNKTLNSSVNAPSTSTAVKKFVASVKFDSSNNEDLYAADHADFNFSSDHKFKITSWIYMPDVTIRRNYISWVSNGPDRIYFRVDVGGDLVGGLKESAQSNVVVTYSGISANTWHYVEFSCDGTTLYLFIDGVLKDSTARTLNTKDYTSPFYIGSSGSDLYFNGYMEDFRVAHEAGHTSNYSVPVAPENMLYPVFEIKDSVGGSETIIGNYSVDFDSWHHVEVTGDGGGATAKTYLFVDGVLQNSGGTDMSNALKNYTENYFIGAHHNGTALENYFKGYIDELQIKKVNTHTASFTPNTSEYGTIGTSPYEVATPYAKNDIFQIKFAQSADTVYLAHPDYAPRKLVRINNYTWKLYTINFLPEPLTTEKVEPSATLTLGQAGKGDSVACTASASVFADGDIGKEIREKASSGQGRAAIVGYTNATTVTIDIFEDFSGTTIQNGKWELVGSNTDGTITISGNTLGGTDVMYGEVVTLTASKNIFAGDATDVGKYITTDDGTGKAVYKIVGSSSTTAVTAVALADTTYDTNLVLQKGEWELKKSVWDSTLGYPGAVSFFENRLLWAGSDTYPDTLWGSVVDDYENHLAGTNDDDAYSFTLAGRQVNKIQWIEDGDSLFIGTAGAEWILGSRGSSAPVTPTNVDARLQTSHGSANVQPIQIGQEVLFVQRDGKRMRELLFSFETDALNATDLNVLAEHIATSGIKQVDYQLHPYSTVWCVTNDGKLLGLTFLKEQKVIAWHEHTTGLNGLFESVAVIPNIPDNTDDVWVIVKRTVNGSTKRFVEKMETMFDASDLTSESFLFMDAGIKYDGVSTATITGLDHLNGETVSVVADGLQQADKTVFGGSITLDSAASHVAVGVHTNAVAQLMKIEAGGGLSGTAQIRAKKIVSVGLRFNKTYNFSLGPSETDTDNYENKFTSGELYSGDFEKVDYPEGWETDGHITVVQDKPFPMTLEAVVAEVELI